MATYRFADVKTAHGIVKFHYVISTPSNPNAPSVDPSVPTVLFLNAVYSPLYTLQSQFASSELRRFNLVSFDHLAHGLTEGHVPPGYNHKQAADDIAAFIDTIQLPPCVLWGLSLGTILALQLAIVHPAKVLGLFLISPLGNKDPKDVADGRRQVFEVWCDAMRVKGIDREALDDALFGAQQLALNSRVSHLTKAVGEACLPLTLKRWTPDQFGDQKVMTVTIFTDREDFSHEELAALRNVPVTLVHCLADIAYPQEYFESFARRLQEANVPTTVHRVPDAAHFGAVTHPAIVNSMCHRFVLGVWKGPTPPRAAKRVVSPFDGPLREAGWDGQSDSSDDDFERPRIIGRD
ncbi:alpha/beta-hydrolase [Auricularia subglabra TFB-10046 SS5]|nr:alpha/beta-hydrolase [Auricularia subglabra TFB-10046 SS5]